MLIVRISQLFGVLTVYTFETVVYACDVHAINIYDSSEAE